MAFAILVALFNMYNVVVSKCGGWGWQGTHVWPFFLSLLAIDVLLMLQWGPNDHVAFLTCCWVIVLSWVLQCSSKQYTKLQVLWWWVLKVQWWVGALRCCGKNERHWPTSFSEGRAHAGAQVASAANSGGWVWEVVQRGGQRTVPALVCHCCMARHGCGTVKCGWGGEGRWWLNVECWAQEIQNSYFRNSNLITCWCHVHKSMWHTLCCGHIDVCWLSVTVM